MAIRQLNRLTPREVETAKDGWHGDGGGLYLRVGDDGKRRRWVFRFIRAGKVTEIGLGRAGKGAVTLISAREKRRKLADAVEKGLNPLAERRRIETAEAGRKTFAEIAEAYIEQEQGGWSASSLRAWKRSLGVDAKHIAGFYADEIALPHVRQAVQPLVDASLKEAARRTQNRIEAVLGYAAEHGFRPEDQRSSWSALAGKRPREHAQRHHRALGWTDLPGAIERVRRTDSMAARALLFMILTATRVSEAREARWSEIDLDKATWTIPADRMKRRKPHAVPLSRQALAILAELKTHRTKSPLAFPGYAAADGEPRAIGRMAMWLLSERATEGRASPHGFRSTFRDWCTDNDKSREHAEHALAHKFGSDTENAYARSTLLKQRRPLMVEWGEFCCGDAAQAADNVVPLRSAG